MKVKNSKSVVAGAVFVILIAILAAGLVPLGLIACFNMLFPAMKLDYTFTNWFAVFLMRVLLIPNCVASGSDKCSRSIFNR
jgi:hypothetical protein